MDRADRRAQAQVEDVLEDATQLSHTHLEHSGAEAIRPRSLAWE